MYIALYWDGDVNDGWPQMKNPSHFWRNAALTVNEYSGQTIRSGEIFLNLQTFFIKCMKTTCKPGYLEFFNYCTCGTSGIRFNIWSVHTITSNAVSNSGKAFLLTPALSLDPICLLQF